MIPSFWSTLLINQMNHLRRYINNVEVVAPLVFLSPIFFLTIKGWSNTICFILFFISLWFVVKDISYYFKDRSHKFFICLACMVFPFVSQVLVLALRGNFVISSLDGVSRFLMAAAIFVFLSRTDVTRLMRLFSYGALLSIPITLVFLIFRFSPFLNQGDVVTKWGGRWCMSFGDPITFSIYFSGIFCLALGYGFKGENKFFKFSAYLLLFVICSFILVKTGSRSGWLGFLLACLIWVLTVPRAALQRTALLIVFVSSIIGIYKLDETVNQRTNDVVSQFLEGGELNSVGMRLSLLKLDLDMIISRPILGWGDGQTPDILEEGFFSRNIIEKEEVFEVKALAGSHSELTAQLVGKGLLFGTINFFGLFVCPILIFISHYSKSKENLSYSKYFGFFLFVVAILFGSFGVQVLNLKMYATFYAMSLALIFASYVSEDNVSRSG
jgi:hypothetical protein